MDDQLFGGLMAAINSFVEELIKDGISSFDLQDKRFSILKKNNIIFIADSSKKVKEKKVLIELDLIAKKFFELYGEDISNVWDNDTSLFIDFGKEIENSLEDTLKKLKDAFW
ncbi:MAG: hypothetical protein ACFFKA_14045 [Candidatus Thorarchaeota archaeon]